MKYYYCQSKWEHAVIEAHNSADAKEKFVRIINAHLEDNKKLFVKDVDCCVVNVYFHEERGLTQHALDAATVAPKCTTEKLCPVHNVWHAAPPRK